MLWLQEKKTQVQKILEEPVAWPTGAGSQQQPGHARQGQQGHMRRQGQQHHARVQQAPRELTVLAGWDKTQRTAISKIWQREYLYQNAIPRRICQQKQVLIGHDPEVYQLQIPCQKQKNC
jgi:hypothetical protein